VIQAEKDLQKKTQPNVAQSHRIGSETTKHQSFPCMEEGSLSTILAFDCGHGYAEEEYAIRNRETALNFARTVSLPVGDRSSFMA